MKTAEQRAEAIRNNPKLTQEQKGRYVELALRAMAARDEEDLNAGKGEVPSRLHNPNATRKSSIGNHPTKVTFDKGGVKVTDPLHAPERHVSATDQYLLSRANCANPKKRVDATCFTSVRYFAQSMSQIVQAPQVSSYMKQLESKLKEVHGSGWRDGEVFLGGVNRLSKAATLSKKGRLSNTLEVTVEFDQGIGHGYAKGTTQRQENIKAVTVVLRYTQYPGGFQGGFINYQPYKAWTVVTAFPNLNPKPGDIDFTLKLVPDEAKEDE